MPMRKPHLLSPLCRALVLRGGRLALAGAGFARNAARTAAAAGAETLDAVRVVGSVRDLQSLHFHAPNSRAVIARARIKAMRARQLDQALQHESGVLAEPFGA